MSEMMMHLQGAFHVFTIFGMGTGSYMQDFDGNLRAYVNHRYEYLTEVDGLPIGLSSLVLLAKHR